MNHREENADEQLNYEVTGRRCASKKRESQITAKLSNIITGAENGNLSRTGIKRNSCLMIYSKGFQENLHGVKTKQKSVFVTSFINNTGLGLKEVV